MVDAETISRLLGDLATERARIDELYRRRSEPAGGTAAATTAVYEVPLIVTMIGGDGGNAVTACTYTYRCVHAETGEVYAGGAALSITGNGQRISLGRWLSGTRGRGYRSAFSPGFVLTWVDETQEVRVCNLT